MDIKERIRMCLIHDFGEAVTGDIPAFEKTSEDEALEENAIDKLISELPERQGAEFAALFQEMKELETSEARLYRGLDKMEEAGRDKR